MIDLNRADELLSEATGHDCERHPLSDRVSAIVGRCRVTAYRHGPVMVQVNGHEWSGRDTDDLVNDILKASAIARMVERDLASGS